MAAGAAACTSFDGTLAVLDTSARNTLVFPMVHGGSAWIGYSDLGTEGTWTWTDSSTSTFTSWAPNEPNNSNEEDCGQLYDTGSWNDLTCSVELPYVCQFPYVLE